MYGTLTLAVKLQVLWYGPDPDHLERLQSLRDRALHAQSQQVQVWKNQPAASSHSDILTFLNGYKIDTGAFALQETPAKHRKEITKAIYVSGPSRQPVLHI